MKNIKITFILLLLFGFASSFAQDKQPATTDQAKTTKSHEDPPILTEEQALLIQAGDYNPAKIDEQFQPDPRMEPAITPSEEDYGESNARPPEGPPEEDPKLIAERAQAKQQASTVVVTQPNSGNSQPAGEKSDNIPDYRNMPGGGSDQPQGDQPENIPNYREMQGSGQQPPGDKPDK